MFVELLCLPSNDIAQPVPDMTAEFGVRRPSTLRSPLSRSLDRHAVSVSELLAGDPPVVGELLHHVFSLPPIQS